MKELFFVNSWPNLESAWSGTPMGLYRALAKRLTIRRVDAGKQMGKLGRLANLLTLGLLSQANFEKQLDHLEVAENAPLFVFGEYISRHLHQTYCYQDMSVDFLLRMRKEKNAAVAGGTKSLVPMGLVKYKAKRAARFYRDCAGVFTMSEWFRMDLIENSGIPAHKVHNVGGGSNIDVSKIDPSRKNGKRFLFVGKAWERKNGELVVAAFKKVMQDHPQLRAELYIAGPQTKPASIDGCENIIYLGQLKYDQLVEYYNLCDYFVMPSKFEAYGLVFVEALCFGLPCIGRDAFAMPEFIQHGQNGLLIQKEDVQELATAMETMLRDGGKMAAFTRENKDRYVQQYAWDSVAERICRVIEADQAAERETE